MNNGPYGPTPPPYDPSGQPQYPQQQQQLAPSGYGGGMGPPSDDTLGWVSVALSGVGWISCCCGPVPFLGILAGLGGILLSLGGAICGYIAWQRAKQQSTRTDIALVGLILGASRLAFVALIMIIFGVVLALGLGGALLEGITHPQ